MTKIQSPPIGCKSVEDWSLLWVHVDGGLKHYQPSLRHVVGLYRVSLKGRIVAIGAGRDK